MEMRVFKLEAIIFSFVGNENKSRWAGLIHF